MKFGIKYKLILSLLIVNSLLAVLMYWMTSQSFDRGFLSYVNKAEHQKLQPLLEQLGERYTQYGNWQWVHENHYQWKSLIDQHILGRKERAPDGNFKRRPTQAHNQAGNQPDFHNRPFPGRNNNLNRPPPRRPLLDNRQGTQAEHRPGHRPGPPPEPLYSRQQSAQLNINPAVLLRDENQQLILGRPKNIDKVEWLDIEVENKKVGELGIRSLNNLSENMDILFSNQQKQTFAYIAIILLFVAIVLAISMASYFLGPIRAIKKSVHKLVAGDYEQTLDINSSDELGQLAHDFNLLTKTLKENQTSRQQWIADISHELRTPVAILQSELDALLDGVRKVDRPALLSLQQEHRRLGNLIDDLHQLSLSDLGALSYSKESLDLAELIRDFLDTHEHLLAKEKFTVTFNKNNTPHTIFADGDRIEQCLTNLLQNTIRYTDKPAKLIIRLEKTPQGIAIHWEDSSPGVDSESIKYLFDRLYRVEKSRNRAKGGAGLGMSICKNIIEAHDGKISVYHSEQGGLGVYIYFPTLGKQAL